MAKKARSEFFKNGTCKWCGETGDDVWRDSHYCERCDRDIVRCQVCKALQHIDNRCRHVFQDENFEWCGAGVSAPTDAVKGAFLALLDHMPEGFAADLKTAIQSGEFYTWLVAPLIGGGGVLELNGMPERNGRWMVHEWGDKMIALGESDEAEKTADGYRWLASLYKDAAPQANQRTIAMIDDWLRRPVRAALAQAEGRTP